MKVSILDTIEEKENGDSTVATCYLCKIDLTEYIESIPSDYREWYVQRGIVKNTYLDAIAETVFYKKHIPAIVLVSDDMRLNKNILEIGDYRILDGLQRTHRLKVIYDSICHLLDNVGELDIGNISRYTRTYSKEIKSIGSDSKLIKKLISLDVLSLKHPLEFFEGTNLWLEIWEGLGEDDQVSKMLMLNAGQKSVNVKHQLELLFSKTWLKLEDVAPENITIDKEKDKSSIQYSKGRVVGNYHFSHIVSSLVSLSAGKVVNTNSDFISKLKSGDVESVELISGFDTKWLKSFLEFLYKMDVKLEKKYGDDGVKWLGREVVLVGFFGAVGAYCSSSAKDTDELFMELINDFDKFSTALKIDEFEVVRNNVKINKVNLGNVNKKAVYRAVSDWLSNGYIESWVVYFGGKNEL